MPTLLEVLNRGGVPLTRVDVMLASFDKKQLSAGVREHFKKEKNGSMKCGLCGASCPHPGAAQAHMAEQHMKQLKATAIKSRIKGFGMSVGHKLPNPSRTGSGAKMGHRPPNPSLSKHKTSRTL